MSKSSRAQFWCSLCVYFCVSFHAWTTFGQDGALLFSHTGARALIAGNTSLAAPVTFEGRFLYDDRFARSGSFFNEWEFALEDKLFYVGPEEQHAHFHGLSSNGRFVVPHTLSRNVWHNIAWVTDGSTESFYVNGQRIGSRAIVGGIRNHNSGEIYLGTNNQINAMLGYSDWFKLSPSALYQGDTFLPPTNLDPSGAIMAFNFGEIGQPIFGNAAGPGHQGSLGSFAQIVPRPNQPAVGDMDNDGALARSDYRLVARALFDDSICTPEFRCNVVGDLDGDAKFSYGDLGVYASWLGLPSPGDFDNDGTVGFADIDLLSVQVRSSSNDPLYDLTGDGMVDQNDRDVWVHDIAKTFFGDFNLSRAVDEADFAIWSANLFTNSTAWNSGDASGDGMVDVTDFNLWHANRGRSPIPAVVPEPTPSVVVLVSVFLALFRGTPHKTTRRCHCAA